jgi:hypothetical protein
MFVRLALFLSSFSPLFLILALRFENPVLRLVSLVAAVVGLGSAWFILGAERGKGAGSFEVKTIEDKGPEVAGYLASYLLPFVALDEPGAALAAGYLIFLVVAAMVYVQSDMVQINPVFYLLGRRVQKVTTSASDWPAYLITRDRALPRETILATTLTNGVLVRADH